MNHETSGKALNCVMSSMSHLLKEGTNRISSRRGKWVEVNVIAISNYRAGPMCYVPPWVWTSMSCNEPGWGWENGIWPWLCPHCQRRESAGWLPRSVVLKGPQCQPPRWLVLLAGPELNHVTSLLLAFLTLHSYSMNTDRGLAKLSTPTVCGWGGIFGVVKYLSKVEEQFSNSARIWCGIIHFYQSLLKFFPLETHIFRVSFMNILIFLHSYSFQDPKTYPKLI